MASKWIPLDEKEREEIRKALTSSKTDQAITKRIIKRLDSSEKRIKVSSAKGKGRALQQEVCRRISNITGIPFNNQDDSCDIHSREMGQAGVDVILRGEAKKKFPFSIECKSVEQISFRDFINQAKANSKEGDWLLVIKTKSIPEIVVCLSWDKFEQIFKGEHRK